MYRATFCGGLKLLQSMLIAERKAKHLAYVHIAHLPFWVESVRRMVIRAHQAFRARRFCNHGHLGVRGWTVYVCVWAEGYYVPSPVR